MKSQFCRLLAVTLSNSLNLSSFVFFCKWIESNDYPVLLCIRTYTVFLYRLFNSYRIPHLTGSRNDSPSYRYKKRTLEEWEHIVCGWTAGGWSLPGFELTSAWVQHSFHYTKLPIEKKKRVSTSPGLNVIMYVKALCKLLNAMKM